MFSRSFLDGASWRRHVWGGLLVVGAAVLYLSTSSSVVLGGDNGEFSAIAAAGGVAHPPGFPLYTIYLRSLSWLPSLSPAHNASLATALLGTASVAVLYLAAVAWGARRGPAALAVGILASSPLYWRLSTSAEVFALNALMAAIVLYLCAPQLSWPRSRHVFWLGLAAGLGISGHHSVVLLTPVGLWAVLRWVRASNRPAVSVGLGVTGLALGLLPYLSLMAPSAPEAMVWGNTRTFSGLMHHFLRLDFGTFSLGLRDDEIQPLLQIATLSRAVAGELLWLPAGVGLVGIVVAFRRRGQPTPWGAVMLLLSLLLAGPVFVSRFNLAPIGVAAAVAERFYVLPMTIFTVFVARGLSAVSAQLSELRWARTASVWGGLGWVGLAVMLAGPTVANHHRPAIELYLRNCLVSAEPRALLLGSGDLRSFGFSYVRRALHLRPDVVYIDVHLLRYAWYQQQIERRLGFALRGISAANVKTPELAISLLASGRPLYMTNVFSPLIPAQLPSYPVGTLIRILPATASLPHPAELLVMNEKLFAEFQFDLSPEPLMDPWASRLAGEYVRPWAQLAGVFDRAGLAGRAEHARKIGASLPLGRPVP